MDQPVLHVGRDASHQLERGLRREWLITNGRGDYGSSTVLLCHTRRYHGLLVAVPPASAKRHVFLSRFEETLHGDARSFPLSIARYPGLWSPHGHDALVGFDLTPRPVFRYRIGDAEVVREVLLLTERRVSMSRYSITGAHPELRLELRPLLAFREADALTHENLHLSTRIERLGDATIRVQPYAELPAMVLSASAPDATFEADPVWYRSQEYQRDLERGYDGHEDLYSPGRFWVPMQGDTEVVVVASVDGVVDEPESAWADEMERRRRAYDQAGAAHDTGAALSSAADDYLYRDDTGRLGVIAGYHWFGEWGRDTYISLPGLTLARGRVEDCAEALQGALTYLRNGLMPNVFGPDGSSSYNSADASLWFAWAVAQYDAFGGSSERLLDEFLPALEEIALYYRDGTALEIGADETGLVHAGRPDLNVTWMDAVTGDGPVTPRDGFAVEINALWYALLAHLARLHERRGDARSSEAWRAWRDRVGSAFVQRFWLPDGPYLADRWTSDGAVTEIRPNMVIAAAMADSPLDDGQRRDVVRVAEAELLTARGLRTLAPDDPQYVGRYSGDQAARDAAYHQGTVWPWLIGFYVEASLRAFGRSPDLVASLRGLLDGFGEHLETAGLGHVSEVFDGDPPHTPGGTIAQAWSTAEWLRARALLEASSR